MKYLYGLLCSVIFILANGKPSLAQSEVLIGSTHTYSCGVCWDFPGGWTVTGGSISGPNNNYNSVTVVWNSTPGPGTVKWGTKFQTYWTISVTKVAPPSPPPTPIVEYNCTNVKLKFNGSPPTDEIWYWQTSSTGTDPRNSAPEWIVYSGTYYIRSKNNVGWSSATSVTALPLDPDPSPPPAPYATGAERCLAGSVTMTSQSSTDQWYDQPTGGTLLYTGSNYPTYLTQSRTYYVQARTVSGCMSATRTPVTATISSQTQGGTVSLTASSQCSGTSAELSLLNRVGIVQQWELRSKEGSEGVWSAWAVHSTANVTNISIPVSAAANVNRYYEFRALVKSGSCNSAYSSTSNLLVYTIPTVAVSSASQTICPGETMTAINITNPNAVTGTTFSWTVSATDISGAANGSGSSIGQTLDQNTSTIKTATYSVTATANGCSSSPVNTVVTVKPRPAVALLPETQSICSGTAMTTVNISNPNGVAGTTYAWTVSAPEITGASHGTGTSFSQTLSQSSSVNQTATYSVTATANGCSGFASNAVVLVKPTPTAAVSLATQDLCNAQTMNAVLISNPNSVTGTTFDWTVSADNVDGASSGYGTFIQQTLSQNTTSNQTATYTVRPKAARCLGPTVNTIVTIYPPLLPGAIQTPSEAICTGSSPGALTSSPASGSNLNYTYHWQTSSDEVGWSDIPGATASNYSPGQMGSSQYFRRKVTSCNQTVNTNSVLINVDQNTIPGTVGQSIEAYGMATGTLTLTGNNGSIQKWEQKTENGNWVDITNTSTSLFYENVNATTYYRVQVKNGVCSAAISGEGYLIIHEVPEVNIVGSNKLAPGGNVLITATTGLHSYRWYRENASIPGAHSSNLEVTKPGTYKLEVTATGTSPVHTTDNLIIHAALSSQEIPINYVLTTMMLKEGINEQTDLYDLNKLDISQSISYADGLGRVVQSVSIGASPSGHDIVQPIIYDQFGRESIKYLAYSRDVMDGRYVPGALAEQASFYQTPGNVTTDSFAFAVTIFEPSPLNRIIKQGAPGQAWQPDLINDWTSTDRTIKKAYESNTAEEVLLLSVIYPTGYPLGIVSADSAGIATCYSTNQLYKNRTKDEHHNEVIEYIDKEGRTLLKRVQAVSAAPVVNDVNYASTYYIYDDFGGLVCVLPPEAVKRLATEYNPTSTTDLSKENFLKHWAFRYKYDGRRRMAEKQVPGAEPVYMVYDNRDRLVMTQDGNQREENKWTFTKYDALNRPIITGIYTHNIQLDQQEMNDLISTTDFFETRDNNEPNGYTNTVFSATDFIASNFEVLTVTYYDDYSFKSLLNDQQYDYKPDEYTGQYVYDGNGNSFPRVVGQVTGTKTKVLGENTYLWAVHYFDDKYRVVQTTSTNTRGDVDRTTMIYDFVGKIIKTKTVHNVDLAIERTVSRTFDYDHVGRLLKTWHSIDGQTPVLLAMNGYNELGQLVDKKLYNTDPAATDDAQRVFKQNVDYRYNIRGWLTSVNDINAMEQADLFGMNLNYIDPTANGGPAQYNGNISEIQWKSAESQGNRYGFYYDALNRITEASYHNDITPAQNGRFNEKIIGPGGSSGYDLNGNIKFLKRNGKTGEDVLEIPTYGEMDNLTYFYQGNQLLKVDDSNVQTHGFIDGTDTDDDYLYDASGNMTLDKNKGITGESTATGNSFISYNFLNLPEKVIKNSGEYIQYTYDATGRKLKQEVFDANNSLTKKTEYAGEFFYENDTLKFINHEEGRIVMTSIQPEYQYHLKDHLGNVRLTFSTKNESESNTATLEEANLNVEQSQFLRYVNTRRIKATLFDHTNGTSIGYSQRLNGTTNEKYGLAKSLSVMPGDTLKVEVFAKYVDPESSNWNQLLTDLMAAVTNNTGGIVVDGWGYSTSTASFSYGGLVNTSGSSATAPKAFLNWIIFDRDYVMKDAGFIQISQAGKENGSDVAHEHIFKDDILIREPGYVYIYLSNENETPVEVFFDDFRVEHIKSPVVQMDDYYPFGLTFNSYQRENSIEQNYQYNGKELQNELHLNWLDYGWRMYQPEIARWNAIDQYASVYEEFSPYSFGANNPIIATDYEGKLIVYVNGFRPSAYGIYLIERTRSRNPLSVPAPHDHKENWFHSDNFNYWEDFNESWSFPDKQRFYVDGSNHSSSTADDRFSKGQTEGKILADKIKSGEVKLEDAETIKLIGHSMGAAHAMGMANGLIDAGIDRNLIQVLLFASHQPNQIESVNGIFLLQAFRDGDKVSGKGDLAIKTNSKNQRIGNNSEYARMPDGDDDGRGNHGIETYTAEEFKQAQSGMYQYLIDKKIINPDGILVD